MTLNTDTINAIIEVFAIITMSLNVRRVYRDKDVKGVSIYASLFGWINVVWFSYFCYALHQPFSFVLSGVYALLNLIWLIFFAYYKFISVRAKT
jgi:hypothetical protein